MRLRQARMCLTELHAVLDGDESPPGHHGGDCGMGRTFLWSKITGRRRESPAESQEATPSRRPTKAYFVEKF